MKAERQLGTGRESTDVGRLLDALLSANNLKSTPRLGWAMRGVPEPESVAAHTYGVALVALALAGAATAEGPFDRAKMLSMALLHDLAESVIGDLPLPAQRFFAANAKQDAERAALAELLSGLPDAAGLQALFEEYQSGTSAEARLVHDADWLDMLIQACVYAQRSGNRALDEFWNALPGSDGFAFEASRGLYKALRDRYRTIREE